MPPYRTLMNFLSDRAFCLHERLKMFPACTIITHKLWVDKCAFHAKTWQSFASHLKYLHSKEAIYLFFCPTWNVNNNIAVSACGTTIQGQRRWTESASHKLPLSDAMQYIMMAFTSVVEGETGSWPLPTNKLKLRPMMTSRLPAGLVNGAGCPCPK